MGTTILGISPGTRSMGVAIIRNDDLVDWKVQTFKGRWSKSKCSGITATLQKLLEKHDIQIVAMKVIHPSRCSKELRQLIASIEAMLSDNGISLYRYTIDDLKGYVIEDGRNNKEILVQYIKQRYPELFRVCDIEERNENSYYMRMIEAVVAARYVSKRAK